MQPIHLGSSNVRIIALIAGLSLAPGAAFALGQHGGGGNAFGGGGGGRGEAGGGGRSFGGGGGGRTFSPSAPQRGGLPAVGPSRGGNLGGFDGGHGPVLPPPVDRPTLTRPFIYRPAPSPPAARPSISLPATRPSVSPGGSRPGGSGPTRPVIHPPTGSRPGGIQPGAVRPARPNRPGSIHRPGGVAGAGRPDQPGPRRPISRPLNWRPPARPPVMAALPGRPARPMTINSSVNSVYRRRPDRPWNRPYRPRYGPYYWNYHHHHWDYDCWYWGTGYADSFYGDVPFGWLLGSAYGVAAGAFSNPYDVADSSPSVYDYSQPVLVSATTEDVSPADDPAAIDASVPIAVTSYFDAARGAFQQGDYPAALAQVDEAIREMPDDAVLHEFRALMFFAMKRYDEAAQVLYSVLAAGPGWDWQTLSSCYANAGTYATQLHALEKYVQQNPKSAAANFVLGYQYMCLGNLQAAAARFQVVTQLQPSDRLSAAFVKRLTRQAAK